MSEKKNKLNNEIIEEISKPNRKEYVLESGEIVVEPFSITPYVLLILLIAVIITSIFSRVDIGMLFENAGNFFDIIIKMFPPDFEYLEKVSQPMIDTIQMSFLGSFLGATFALPVALFASTNIIKNKYVIVSIRLFLSTIRTLPVLIYASLLTLIFGIGPFAGTLAISIFTFAIVSKMLYEKIETIDMGAFLAIESTGATKVNAFTSAVLPQIMPNYLSISLYSFEINIRYAAILGYVGAGGVGLLLDDRMQWRAYDQVAVVLIALLVTVVTIENLSRYIRGRLG